MQHDVQLLNQAITQAKITALYKRKLGHTTSITRLEDFYKLPFTTKQDLRDSYPYGNLAVPIKQVVEVHTSSGTTGKPTLSMYTQEDLTIANHYIAKSWKNFGITSASRLQFLMGYGLFSGAALNTYALQALGAFVIPAGIQPTEKQVELMMDFGTDTIVATPSYYLWLYNYLRQHNIDPADLPLKTGIAAGEAYSDELKQRIASLLGIRIYDHYGLCEVNTGIIYECNTCGRMAVLKDYVFAEVVDPTTGEQLPEGEYGELVLTALQKQASPILRYKTGDSAALLERASTCKNCYGSTIISRIKGRLDDTIFYRGLLINPHEVRDLIVFESEQHIINNISFEVATDEDNIPLKITARLIATAMDDHEAFARHMQERLLVNTKVPITVTIAEYDSAVHAATTKTKLVNYVK